MEKILKLKIDEFRSRGMGKWKSNGNAILVNDMGISKKNKDVCPEA